MTHPNRFSKTIALAILPLALGMYWLLAHASIADMDDQPPGYVSAVEMSNYDVSSGSSVIYRGDFFRGNWDGNLIAHKVDSSGGTTVTWQARAVLATQSWDSGRKIFTMNGTSGVPFRWNTTLTRLTMSAAQQSALGGDPQGRHLLEFTRGNGAYEGTTFRQRFSKLGDIIHSRPYYVNYGSGVERVYVGANDGMLHAFDATNGKEVFAYIPSMLIPKLSQFAVNPYTNHKYGVDGLLSIADLTRGTAKLKLLAGGMGAGAKGIFALDITNPAPDSETGAAGFAKWEITEASADFGNLGHVYGAPQIVKLNDGTQVVLVPNGINSINGKASLFVVDALGGNRLAEIFADSSGPDNGLTAIAAADLNGDGKVDFVYGGDLKGNLWKFDFRGASYPAAATALFTPTPDTARPIMAAPAISAHPAGGVMVNFGTGKMLEASDLTSTTNEYLYGVRDSARVTRGTLAEPVLSTGLTTATPPLKYRVASRVTVNYANGDKGWRITLAGGERLIGGDLLVNSGRFIVTTTQPDPASANPGTWLLQVDALTGSGPAKPFIDLDANGAIDLAGTTDKVRSTDASGNASYSAPAGKFLGTGVWSQPVLAKINNTFDLPYFNFNPNRSLSTLITTTTTTTTTTIPGTDRGVAGGHFDFDIYYNQCNPLKGDYGKSCTVNTHVHEYDDTYDVVGVNLLKASEPNFNLSKAFSSTSTRFKLLIANQKFSPAAQLTIGSVTKAVWAWPLSPGGFIADTPGGTARTFTQATINKLILSLPLNAFTNQEWMPGSRDVRAGLIPTQTGCVRENRGAQGSGTSLWMNGALTLQIVKDSTTNAAVELNQSGNSAQGYRLKKDATSQANQLAQYTMFWHHPNKLCYGDAGWTQVPPPDPKSNNAAPKTPAAGSDDPKGNFASSFGSLGGGSGSVSTRTTTYDGVEVTVVLRYDPATGTYTETITTTSNGSVATNLFGPNTPLPPQPPQTGTRARLGRLSWQEIVR